MARGGADGGACLVLEGNTFVPRAGGDERRTRAVEGVAFVADESLETVPDGIDVGDPFEGADHVGLRDGVDRAAGFVLKVGLEVDLHNGGGFGGAGCGDCDGGAEEGGVAA